MSQSKERSEKFERGLKTRRAVVGDAYVDKSIAVADEFTWPMQVLVTENCWEDIWNRPGLDRRSRSILNLGMIAALNRPHELRLHVRGAINNGMSREELREVCLQVACYCGFPAALDTQRIVLEVLAEMDAEAKGKK
ncbi:MAG TPA: carboxymuconolactone decarboxylase family protein [Stellaceae bacterium]|jgi:4-carboxymuconolactone decarboxylase|nr:carboxymuconolactone decarboxylase family protein [Stellaceae bacterium]